MNKRQYKKFQKKLCCVKYKDYEYKKILAIADEILRRESEKRDIGHPMIYLQKSKKGKYIYPPKIFTNVMPVSSSGFIHDDFSVGEERELSIDFRCKLYISPSVDHAASIIEKVQKSWIEGLTGGTTDEQSS